MNTRARRGVFIGPPDPVPRRVEHSDYDNGRLWITGHDLPEAYVLELPEAGSELRWIATVELRPGEFEQ